MAYGLNNTRRPIEVLKCEFSMGFKMKTSSLLFGFPVW